MEPSLWRSQSASCLPLGIPQARCGYVGHVIGGVPSNFLNKRICRLSASSGGGWGEYHLENSGGFAAGYRLFRAAVCKKCGWIVSVHSTTEAQDWPRGPRRCCHRHTGLLKWFAIHSRHMEGMASFVDFGFSEIDNMIYLQPPHPDLQHGPITSYSVGYRLANSTEPFRYVTVDARDPNVSSRAEQTKCIKFPMGHA